MLVYDGQTPLDQVFEDLFCSDMSAADGCHSKTTDDPVESHTSSVEKLRYQLARKLRSSNTHRRIVARQKAIAEHIQ